MKVNKFFLFAILASLSLTLIACAASFKAVYSDWCDLRMRYHEVCCAHDGINSFHIWNRTVESEKYRGGGRPDIQEEISANDTRAIVHAYPPWHTAFFWWYGWLPWQVVLAVMATFYWVVFLSSFVVFKRWSPDGKLPQVAYWASLSVLMLNSFRVTYVLGNYGCVLLFTSLVIVLGLKKYNSFALGLSWALMMIKPQIGILFFWPLLFAKRYMAIITAIVVCLLATLFSACVYQESPIDLILQVQRLGEPYLRGNSPCLAALNDMTSGFGVTFWSLICFIFCGVWSYKIRESKSNLIKFLPVCAFIPFWTYSNLPDWLVFWPLYVLMAQTFSSRFSWSVFLLVLSFPCFYYGYHALAFLGWAKAGDYHFPYACYKVAHIVLTFLFLLEIYYLKKKGLSNEQNAV